METCTLDAYFDLAFAIQFLRRTHGAMPEYVINAIDRVAEGLKEHELVHASAQTAPLKAYREQLKNAVFQNGQPFANGMPPSWINSLNAIMEPIVRNVGSEGHSVVLTRLNYKAVSPRLRDFGQTKLTTDQEALKSEVINCTEVGAFRAAMVMAWNLAFDIFRRWLFHQRLSEFNAVLTTKERKRGKSYTAIAEYDDFFLLQERDVVNWSLQADLLTEKVHRALVERLDRRNDYAHANFKHPDAGQVMGYMSELMTILEDAPVRFGK